jgi:hypothetical protein
VKSPALAKTSQRLRIGDAVRHTDASLSIPAPAKKPITDPNAGPAVAHFLRSLYVLLRSMRLYQKNHPRVFESLEVAERALHSALHRVSPVAVGIEGGAIILPGVRRGTSAQWLGAFRAECEALAEELARCGISTLVFGAHTDRDDLDSLVQLLHRRSARKSLGAEVDWQSALATHSIRSIRVNVSLEHKMEAELAGLLSALLSFCGLSPGESGETGMGNARKAVPPRTEEELMAAQRLLAQLAPLFHAGDAHSATDSVLALHAALADTERRNVALVADAMLRQGPREGEAPRLYLARLAEILILEFVAREFLARRTPASSLRSAVARLSEGSAAILQAENPPAEATEILADWEEEAYVEGLYERLWELLPSREKARVLHSREAWCAPLAAMRRALEQLIGADTENYPREARLQLLLYSGCLELENEKARRAVAAGLVEMQPLIEKLWPQELPTGLVDGVMAALHAEVSPGTATLLARVTENLAGFALGISDYAGFERIVESLEDAPRDDDHAHISELLARIVADERWMEIVDAGLSQRPRPGAIPSRHLDPEIPNLLRRDPERALEHLGTLLTGANGQDLLPAMARLIRAIGEPAIGALEARLFQPRRQQAVPAVKLLAAAEPKRLLDALPRALPSWDWSLQDLAISELARPAYATPMSGLASTFLETLPEAHAMVVPVLLDIIGQERDPAAVPVLLEIVAGTNERWRDIFIRIKAIEALGRMRAREAAELLLAIIRQRNGLTHTEPAGLRAAAEEALALIENRPSSVRVRTSVAALEKTGDTFHRPRRYIRIPLSAPLRARIEGPAAISVRVRTISMGGAYLESGRRLSVGDSLRVEIRSGLHHLRATAVVRNVAGSGGGVEFLHMKAGDRERLRRLVRRFSDD